MKKFDLDERMVLFASTIIRTVDLLPPTFASKHLGRQLIRSGTSAALNYGEAQAAESTADFIHKLKLALKELKESFICLRIMAAQKYIPNGNENSIIQETNELISILVASIKTARRNQATKTTSRA